MHHERSGLPDIDVDSESNKRNRIFNGVREYFQSINGDMIHVCTFGTEGSKSALRTAGRGLGIDDDVIAYLTVMVPNERGFDWTLNQCYSGDDDHTAIAAFKEQIDQYPMLWKVAKRIEGLVTRLGCHASGVLALNEPIYSNNSQCMTSKKIMTTAWDLEDTEQMGGTKYDYLTIQALDKIRTCMNLMLEDGVITWQGSLRATYDKYLHPDVIDYKEPKMWDMLYNNEIPSAFQFDSIVGGQAIKLIHPQSLAELVAANGLMRLMANEETGILPMDAYVQHKNDITTWYREMSDYGLTTEEQKVLEPYLLPTYGVCISQETVMRLSMDPHISNFTIGEANVLRKAIA